MTETRHLLSGHRGTCRECMRARKVYPCGRTGGGTYKRGSRSYRSSICGDCAVRLLSYAGTHAGAHYSRWAVSGLLDVAEVHEPEAAATYRARRDEARAAEQARRERSQP